ncbi:hypothetical protein [Streptomyces sp. NPDC020965]|uniref:hypothetical protein n=1 Tax=Streptomyces sp. NPDC020965 TaxID=3365105 RepID=UPI0037B39DA2
MPVLLARVGIVKAHSAQVYDGVPGGEDCGPPACIEPGGALCRHRPSQPVARPLEHPWLSIGLDPSAVAALPTRSVPDGTEVSAQ